MRSFPADIGTEELAHMEIVAAIVHQLTRNLSMDEIAKSGFDKYYTDHTIGVWPQSAGGVPFTANQFQVTGDPITDLTEDLAAEQKARTTYDNILRLIKEPDVCEPIKFLRAREVVHFQRFGEAKPAKLSGLSCILRCFRTSGFCGAAEPEKTRYEHGENYDE